MEVDRLARRKICVVTTSRADYGYLRGVMREIRDDGALDLAVLVGGSHLVWSEGLTARDIEADGFAIAGRLEFAPASDRPVDAAKAVGVATAAFAQAFEDLDPDVVVLLGDRYEILAPAIACLLQRIPLAHVHGGESTVGAVDESVRHAVTKLSTYHFPATEPYRRRLIRMGEAPDRVFNCGSPGLDSIREETRPTRAELSKMLSFALDAPTALIAFHPATLDPREAATQVSGMLDALDRSGLRGIATRANADPGGSVVNAALDAFCVARADRFRLYGHLGSIAFHGALEHLEVLVGNSSSGIIEAPFFGTPVVNIGDRQKGRLRSPNILDCGYGAEEILVALRRATSASFRQSLVGMANPYDEHKDGRAAWHIKERLKTVPLDATVLRKPFWDGAAAEDA